MILTIDFETRSKADIKKSGPWKYAADPSTEVICCSFKVDDEPSRIWVPEKFRPYITGLPQISYGEISTLIEKAEIIEAHNREFESAIWQEQMVKKHQFAPLDPLKADCTAARAAVHALPRKLEDVCKVTRVNVQKDIEGHKLMLKLCKPRKPRKAEREADPQWASKLYWHENPEDIRRLCEYCLKDTDAERAASKVLRPLSQKEREIWRLDQAINARGVCIDIDNIKGIVSTLEIYEEELLSKMEILTDYKLNSPRQTAKLQEWLLNNGISVENVQKQTIKELMKTELPQKVRQVLEIRQALSKASTAKFQAMIARANDDNRARGMFMYHGAGTGRWTAKGLQPQNLPRDSYKDSDLEDVYEAFKRQDTEYIAMFYDDPFVAASKCIRGSIIPAPGKKFICADYSAIEARGNAWLAGEQKVLDAFRSGVDLYKVAATGIFGNKYEDVTSEQRQLGKVCILALGYQGGIAAFASMAKVYGIDLETLPALILPFATAEELEGPYGAKALASKYITDSPEEMSYQAAIACDIIKRKWRDDNKFITSSWKKYEEAASQAVMNPGDIFIFNKVKFRTWVDNGGNKYLCCQLPSGRVLYYFAPKVETIKTPWGEKGNSVTCRTVDGVTKQWVRRPLYGGLICENITQAVCRDILAEAQLRTEAKGYPTVLHVHDEIVSEVDEGFGSLEEFEKIMEELPTWAGGFPLKAEGWVGYRFRK